MIRCKECGSWDAVCSADKAVRGCTCARCLREEVRQMERQLKVTEAFLAMAVKERDEARGTRR